MKKKDINLEKYTGGINAYRRSLNGVKEIKPKELKELLIKLKNPVTRSEAEDELIVRNRLLVHTLAFRMAWWVRFDHVLDIISDGCMALTEAVREFDGSKGCQFTSFITDKIKEKILDNINTYQYTVYRPKCAEGCDSYFDVSLDECVEDEDGLTRADMLVGDMKTGRGLQRRSSRTRVISIIRGVLDEERADVMLKLLGFCGHWYTENMVADEKGLTVTRILQMKREAIEKLIESAYFETLKELLV